MVLSASSVSGAARATARRGTTSSASSLWLALGVGRPRGDAAGRLPPLAAAEPAAARRRGVVLLVAVLRARRRHRRERLEPVARRRAASASSRPSSPSWRCCSSGRPARPAGRVDGRHPGHAAAGDRRARPVSRCSSCCSPTWAPRSCWRRSCSPCSSWPARRSARWPAWGTLGVCGRGAPVDHGALPARSPASPFLHPWQRPAQHGLPDDPVAGRAWRPAACSASGSGPAGPSGASCRYAHTDFIFAIIGEELGLVGALLVVVPVRRASASSASGPRCGAPDRSACSSPAGITAWVVRAGASSTSARSIGVLPITGVPLPFVSFGGSSLLVHDGGGRDPAEHRPPERGASDRVAVGVER